MSKSILTIDTPKGCVFCPLAKMYGFNAFVKQETVMDRQPYMGITCPFCSGIRFIYNLTADEVLTYKHKECPLRESEDTISRQAAIDALQGRK